MLYFDRYKYLACKCHSMGFVWSETLRNNRKWGFFFALQKKQKKIPDGGLSVRRETWEATFHSCAKGTMRLRAHRAARMGGESSKWDERWRKVQEKKKNQLPKFWGLSKSAQSLALACFSLGAPARPSCSCYEANSHICWEDRRWDRKTLNKAAKTGWHNNPLLCLRGAESWDVRVCNWMSDLFFFLFNLDGGGGGHSGGIWRGRVGCYKISTVMWNLLILYCFFFCFF